MMLLTLFTTLFAMAAAAPTPDVDGNPGEYVRIQFYQGAKCTNADSGQLSISDTGCHSFSADGLRVIDKHPNLRFDALRIYKGQNCDGYSIIESQTGACSDRKSTWHSIRVGHAP